MLGRAAVNSVATNVSAAGSFIPAPTPGAVGSFVPTTGTRVVESFIAACRSKVVESLVPAIERLTVRNECVVIEHNRSVPPIASPAVRSPSETSEQSDREAHTDRNAGARNVQPGIWVPAGPHDHRRTIHDPGIVCRNVNDLRVCRFNDDGRTFSDYLYLFIALQVSGRFCASPHDLHGVHHSLLLVHVSLAKGRCPGKVLVHVGQHGGKLSERLNTGIPRLLIDGVGEIFSLEGRVLLHPAICLNNFGGIRCSAEYL